MDPYLLLGVSKTSSQDDIKTAYRKLAKQLHPDLNPGNKEAEKRFKDISAAYEQIGTPDARARFERGEQEPETQGGAHRGPFYYQTQGDGRGRYRFHFDPDAGFTARARDENYRMEIELSDTVTGTVREIALPGGKRLEVRIPPGMTTGSRLRFAGMSRSGGDVYVEIQVKPSEQFRIEGDNLVIDLAVPVDDAVLGAESRIPTIDGMINLNIPPKVDTGQRLRIPGKGLVNRTTRNRGDLIVVIRVHLPKSIDPQLEDALRAWRKRQRKAA